MRDRSELKRQLKRFENLDFEEFKKLAKDPSMNCYQKIGFPTEYREGKECDIFKDIQAKLPLINQTKQCVLDIGPGCSELAMMLIELCEKNNHELILVDSQEMLDLLPNKPFIRKIAGRFPLDVMQHLLPYKHKINVLLCYSVMHYVFAEGNWFNFLDEVMSLMDWGSQGLLGDLPNQDMRQRFFSSPNGIAFHQEFMQTDEPPLVNWQPAIQENRINDGVIFASLMRIRAAGYHGYVVPQASDLPTANRREDLLIHRP